MSLPHFFLEEQIVSHAQTEVFSLSLCGDDIKHMRALRLEPGEHIAVVDAENDYFECEVVSFDGAQVEVRISSHLQKNELPVDVVLVQGLAKGEKMEMVIRHATELGVSSFYPLCCERSIVRLDAKKAKARVQRWRAIVKSAAMQSGRSGIPQVAAPSSIDELAPMLNAASAVLVCWEEADVTRSLSEALSCVSVDGAGDAKPYVAVVVGPEGGLSQNEIDKLLASNAHASLVTLGSTILRTETAGLIAPALTLYELGGLGSRA